MTHTPNELAEMLPEHAAAIHGRKLSDPHFARLADEYHALNREIHRGETDVEPTDDAHLTELRRRRLALLDELRDMLVG